MSRTELLSLTRSSAGVSDNGLIVTSRTGVIAAGAGALSTFWGFQPSFPSSVLTANPVALERLRLQWTCITAFTTPVLAGRELAFCQLAEMPGIGGSNSCTVRKGSLDGAAAGGGVACVSNTAPLTQTTPPDPNDIFARVSLAGYGAAGATLIKEWRWDSGSAQMISQLLTEPIGLICTNAMDAGGTFELVIEADYQAVPEGWPGST